MATEMVGSMVGFTIVLMGIVYAILPSLRRHKRIDLLVFRNIEPRITKRNTRIMTAISGLARHTFLVPANLSLIGYFLFIHRRTWFSIRIASIALSSLLLMLMLKNIFRRKRPDFPVIERVRGLSFPSGHAIFAVTFYGLLIYIANQSQPNRTTRVAITLSFLSLINLIGLSRVWLRVHYASDVLAGYLIGGTWLLTSLTILKRLDPNTIVIRNSPVKQ